jgi:NADPH-dependent 2,4-dienoyl-CoA reductase/sulfur reductase-like enzyme
VGVETTSGQVVPCQILGVAIGVRPRIEVAHLARLQVERGIVVNEFMQTSAPDVFAAGDVAQVYDPRSKRATLDTLWSTALAQGQAAGTNMAGVQIPYVKGVALNVTRLAGLTTTIIGGIGSGRDEDLLATARGDSEAWRIMPEAWVITERHEVNRIRLLVDERTIVGALVMGDQTLSRPLQYLIAAQVDISPIREAIKADPTAIVSLIPHLHRQWECATDSPTL